MVTLKKIGMLFLLVLVFASCQTIALHEQSTTYPDHQWSSKQSNHYQFIVSDTAATYNIYFVIRHHNAYHYKNIWIELATKAPGDSVTKQQVNLNLADDQKGWLGTGMDDIYDQRIPMNSQPIKLRKGLYEFTIQHTMREDPLQNILSTGIRVEKAR